MPIDATAVAQAAEKAAAQLGMTDTEEEVGEQQTAEPAEETTQPEKEEVAEEGKEVGEEVEPGEEPTEEQPKTVPIARFHEIYGRYKQLERAMQVMMAQQEQALRAAPREEPKELKMPDFEQMSEADKAKWILNSVRDMVKSEIKASVEPIEQGARQERADKEVAECARTHKDFPTYAPVMVEIANRHPSLGAEEVYQLAKAMSPGLKQEAEKTQVKEIAKKVKEKTQLKKAARTEKRSSSSEKVSEKDQFKTVREAALAAAEKLGIK